MDATSGHRAAVMGDVNCDLGDSSPGAYAWGQALNATGYDIVAIDRVGEWGALPTRFPRGDQPGEPRHIDTVVVSGPGMLRYDPQLVSIGTETEVDTPGYGGCPVALGPECPNCTCIEHQHSDHKLVVWEFEAKLRPARAKRPDQLRWKMHMGDLLENKDPDRQAAYATCATDQGELAKIVAGACAPGHTWSTDAMEAAIVQC